MYEVSCVAGNKVDAAYAVKSLSNVIPPGMGHTVSVQRHHAHSQSYKHKPDLPPPVSKPDALKSHVMRLLKRSKSHTPATRAAENQVDPRSNFIDRRTVFTRPVTDEQRRRRNSAERRRSTDKRVMVTIVDGLPVVVTGRDQVPPLPQHPPPVTHHRHSHRDKV
ncbi:hypothetical protein MSG28_015624 [Choristoneura fumiferana]|uniref:Uncharacterized protein n=1 Tax=Choristoneura fumiferana TaxID=7141 RepID=A0ACC0KAU8_CHOFU|nr:hypothetical protein MSG28_015624 [Choristoneura fumiferana]